MYSPGRFEAFAGVALMVPGVVVAVSSDGVPVQALFNPGFVPAFFVGALFDASPFAFGLGLLYSCYYAGLLAALVSLFSSVRGT